MAIAELAAAQLSSRKGGVMKRAAIGLEGEEECARQLEQRGWTITKANSLRANFPNVDLFAEKDGRRLALQVKTSRKERGYITGGGVSRGVVEGGSIFNRVSGAPHCDVVLFLTCGPAGWRFFVAPVGVAERLFRRNIEAYFKSPKLDGGVKKPTGQADIFVGSGPFPHGRIVPDQRSEVLPFENRWELLDTFGSGPAVPVPALSRPAHGIDYDPQVLVIVRAFAAGIQVRGKIGKSMLQPALACELRSGGFNVDEEDSAGLLRAGMPVWRSKDDGRVVPTMGRRRLDLVVYRGSHVAALIETESDLNDLRESGVSSRSGHYDVASIARRADGSFFNSYNSLERMAAAAYFHDRFVRSGTYPEARQAAQVLEEIASDAPTDHNPAGILLVLVSGLCRPKDAGILKPRLDALGAHLVCCSSR
jgi:Holliday junction resolvase